MHCVSTGSCDDQPLAVAINAAYAQGVVSAAAAGNEANTDALIIPACASKAVSVGAVHAVAGKPVAYSVCTDTVAEPDSVACFSNRCVEPGAARTDQSAQSSSFSCLQATCFICSKHDTSSHLLAGTSMQAPLCAPQPSNLLVLLLPCS